MTTKLDHEHEQITFSVDKTSIRNDNSASYYYTISKSSNGNEPIEIYQSRTTIMDRVLWRDDVFTVPDPDESGFVIQIHRKKNGV